MGGDLLPFTQPTAVHRGSIPRHIGPLQNSQRDYTVWNIVALRERNFLFPQIFEESLKLVDRDFMHTDCERTSNTRRCNVSVGLALDSVDEPMKNWREESGKATNAWPLDATCQRPFVSRNAILRPFGESRPLH